LKVIGHSQQFVSGNDPGKRGAVRNEPVVQGKLPAEARLDNSVVKQGKTSSPANTGGNLTNLLSALKMPQDNLSRSIIGFARFFSLPLDPKLLNSLRREALHHRPAARDAAALGAAAASDKGLKLSAKALGEYAAAIEGNLKSFTGKSSEDFQVKEQLKDRDGRQETGSDHPENGNQQESGSQHGQPGGSFRDNASSDREKKALQEQLTGGCLQRRITAVLKEKPLLDFINRVPGKNSRWIVIPFSYNQDGLEINVSMRVLSEKKTAASPQPPTRLALDIAVKHGASGVKDGGSHWHISLEKPGTAANDGSAALPPESKVIVFSEMAARSPADRKKLRKGLAKALGLPLDSVTVREKKPLFADSYIDQLRSVDEEV